MNKLELPLKNSNIEISIATVISKPIIGRGKDKRKKLINESIENIKEMQKLFGITHFTRKFLSDILKRNSSLSERVRQKRVKEILSYAKQKDGIISKKHLVNKAHYEYKLKGELTISSVSAIDRVWEERNVIVTLYSFV